MGAAVDIVRAAARARVPELAEALHVDPALLEHFAAGGPLPDETLVAIVAHLWNGAVMVKNGRLQPAWVYSLTDATPRRRR